MLAGLGQIHIAATVNVVDAVSQKTVAQYEATKDSGWGGMYGGSTSVEDVEEGFAKSIAVIFQSK